MTSPDLSRASLLDVLAHVRAELAAGARAIAFRVLDPDHGRGRYAGEPVEHGGVTYVHRPWRAWVDLADRLGLRLATPRPADPPLVELRLEALDPAARWQDAAGGADPTEKYGAASGFARIRKAEEPGFVLDLEVALARVPLPARPRILDLGVNTGDELALIAALAPGARDATFVGVDHSASALAAARRRFPGDAVRLVQADLADLGAHDLGRFDLVVSIGTLQSPGVDDRALLRRIVQDLLAPDGSVILGVPNCRYLDGEVQRGARIKNLREPELGLVIKDVAFYRTYLHQHGRRVFVTGDHDLLITAVPIPRSDRASARSTPPARS